MGMSQGLGSTGKGLDLKVAEFAKNFGRQKILFTPSGIRQKFRYYQSELARPKVLATSATHIVASFVN